MSALSFFLLLLSSSFFFFNDTATTEIYTLSLHDALPSSLAHIARPGRNPEKLTYCWDPSGAVRQLYLISGALADRKSTRLNSSHSQISYAVFCLKKKKKKTQHTNKQK